MPVALLQALGKRRRNANKSYNETTSQAKTQRQSAIQRSIDKAKETGADDESSAADEIIGLLSKLIPEPRKHSKK